MHFPHFSFLHVIGLHNEGWFDPYLLLSAFKQKVLSRGVHYVRGEITGLCIENERVNSVEVHLDYINYCLFLSFVIPQLLCPSSLSSSLSLSNLHSMNCKYFVNATGPHAAAIALMAGIGSSTHPNPVMRYDLPVRPRKRCVFVLHCPDGPKVMPMFIDPSGFYIRRETQKATYICGISPNQVSNNKIIIVTFLIIQWNLHLC